METGPVQWKASDIRDGDSNWPSPVEGFGY
jgi:hypothetical protein